MNQLANNYENQLALIEGENVNVSESNDAKSFIKIIFQVTIVIFVVIFSCEIFSNIAIDKMSDKTQIHIEKILSIKNKREFNTIQQIKYIKQLAMLNAIKNKIISEDKTIQKKSKFQISVLDDKEINACILPDGSIFFTKGLLEENFSEQELAFVLAHEIGHYSHRDHLKSVSRNLMLYGFLLLLGKDSIANKVASGISETTELSHSRGQEKQADLYASNMLKKIYGTNQGGIDFINKIKEKENEPEFLYYFSTHPSWKARLKLLQN